MGKTTKLTTEQQETLRFVYAQTGNISAAAREVGCSVAGAHRYITEVFPKNPDGLEDLRREIQVSVLDKMKEVQRVYLDELMKPDTIAKAGPRDMAAIIDTVSKNALLLGGKATERFESTVKTVAIEELTPTQRKAMATLRAKLAEGEQTTVAEILDESLVDG